MMSGPPERLWAKRWCGVGIAPDSAYLLGHLQAVYRSAEAVLDASAADQLTAVGLNPVMWSNRLYRVVLFAAATHDLGKANDQFQDMITGRLNHVQALRHEWVTYLLLTHDTWRAWSARAFEAETDWHIALWCATGHHPGLARPSPPLDPASGTGTTLTLFREHPDFAATLSWIAQAFRLDAPPLESNCHFQLTGAVAETRTAIQRAFSTDVHCFATLTGEEKRLAAAAKACLVAADVAGSAIPKQTTSLARAATWVKEALTTRPSTDDIQTLVHDKLGQATLRPFQLAAAESTSRVTLIRAGCGTGKTIAAYLWAAHRCSGRRVYVCYPTTGTATEGFRGYLLDGGEKTSKFGARLFHSRSQVDMEMMLGVAEDLDEHDTALRIESLAAWSTPIVSCTVDTVLGLMQNHRNGLFAWPAIAQSAFVFDEVHAYDKTLFGALLRFIETMRGLPILLMTASLSQAQHKAIDACLARTGETPAPLIEGPRDLERLKRYQCSKTDNPLTVAKREIEDGGRVLWICNTVARAMAVSDDAAQVGIKSLIYHSRFRYEDRVERHTAVIEAFEENAPTLAICTQVAEMSLDLSATLLVTDLAPVPALIQRLGRLNRRASVADPRPFIITKPLAPNGGIQSLPYADRELDIARQWLSKLGNGPLSQADLSRAWNELQTAEQPTPIACTWIDGGPRTVVGELREASPGMSVILQRDVAKVRADAGQLKRVLLPMGPPPRSLDWRNWRQFGGIPIAPDTAIVYSTERGGQWQDR